MNSAQLPIPPQSSHRTVETPRGVLSSVRNQVAFVRALLDEIERVAPADAKGVSEQLVEELARLGCRCIEVASTRGVCFRNCVRATEPPLYDEVLSTSLPPDVR